MSRRNKNRPAGSAQPNTLTLDAFSNPLFRLGYGSQSPLEATSYPLTRMTGNYALLNSLYRENWVVQNVVALLVDDMLREWYDLKDAAPDQLKALRGVERRTGLRRCISTGLKWGRLYGRCRRADPDRRADRPFTTAGPRQHPARQFPGPVHP